MFLLEWLETIGLLLAAENAPRAISAVYEGVRAFLPGRVTRRFMLGTWGATVLVVSALTWVGLAHHALFSSLILSVFALIFTFFVTAAWAQDDSAENARIRNPADKRV